MNYGLHRRVDELRPARLFSPALPILARGDIAGGKAKAHCVIHRRHSDRVTGIASDNEQRLTA